jgi:hypothetical protein
MSLNTQSVIRTASKHLQGLKGHVLNEINVAKPVSSNAAVNLTKIVSKLSPIVGNLIDFNTCEKLNSLKEFRNHGIWARQDPGFPDIVLNGSVAPRPGFEVKVWFPLATEMTARFKDSVTHFADDNTYVAMLAWLPEHLIYGSPKVLDIIVVSAASVAEARDTHYHNPPDYLVVEPRDTTARTRNLQQTNTNGYKWQSTDAGQKKQAERIVANWKKKAGSKSAISQHDLVGELRNKFLYRQDTNYAKMDRIEHPELEAFKTRVSRMKIHGRTIEEWRGLLNSGEEADIVDGLSQQFDIRDL